MAIHDITSITKLEKQYTELLPHFQTLQEALEKFSEMYPNYHDLRSFYGSDHWFEWAEKETPNIKASILSQDTLYDLILQHNEILESLLDLAALMYKER